MVAVLCVIRMLVGDPMNGFTFTNSALIILNIFNTASVPPKTGNTARNQPQHNSDANSTYVIIACGIFKHVTLKTVDFALRPEFKMSSILITYKHTGLHVSYISEAN